LVIAYLIKTRKVGFKEAIALVRAKRKNVCPNLGFEKQLKAYEQNVLANEKINNKKTIV
jgi:protein-tyrosine phosphatase